MVMGKGKLPKINRFVNYHFPYLRYLKSKMANEKIRLRWKSYFRKEFLSVLDNSFDFVLFSWCGIDAASHAGRKRILAEVRRVLHI